MDKSNMAGPNPFTAITRSEGATAVAFQKQCALLAISFAMTSTLAITVAITTSLSHGYCFYELPLLVLSKASNNTNTQLRIFISSRITTVSATSVSHLPSPFPPQVGIAMAEIQSLWQGSPKLLPEL